MALTRSSPETLSNFLFAFVWQPLQHLIPTLRTQLCVYHTEILVSKLLKESRCNNLVRERERERVLWQVELCLPFKKAP